MKKKANFNKNIKSYINITLSHQVLSKLYSLVNSYSYQESIDTKLIKELMIYLSSNSNKLELNEQILIDKINNKLNNIIIKKSCMINSKFSLDDFINYFNKKDNNKIMEINIKYLFGIIDSIPVNNIDNIFDFINEIYSYHFEENVENQIINKLLIKTLSSVTPNQNIDDYLIYYKKINEIEISSEYNAILEQIKENLLQKIFDKVSSVSTLEQDIKNYEKVDSFNHDKMSSNNQIIYNNIIDNINTKIDLKIKQLSSNDINVNINNLNKILNSSVADKIYSVDVLYNNILNCKEELTYENLNSILNINITDEYNIKKTDELIEIYLNQLNFEEYSTKRKIDLFNLVNNRIKSKIAPIILNKTSPYFLAKDFKQASAIIPFLSLYDLYEFFRIIRTKGYMKDDSEYCNYIRDILKNDKLNYNQKLYLEKLLYNVENNSTCLCNNLTIQDAQLEENKTIITVDNDLAEFYDTAFSLEKQDNGYILDVYITDVPSFLNNNPKLYELAYNNGEKNYGYNEKNNVNVAIMPMIPCDNILSLTANKERNVIDFKYYIDNQNNISFSSISKKMIKVSKNYGFTQFDNIIKYDLPDENKEMICEYKRISGLLDSSLINATSKLIQKTIKKGKQQKIYSKNKMYILEKTNEVNCTAPLRRMVDNINLAFFAAQHDIKLFSPGKLEYIENHMNEIVNHLNKQKIL